MAVTATPTPEAILALALTAGWLNTCFHLVYHRVPLYLSPRDAFGDAAGKWPPLGQIIVAIAALASIWAFGLAWRPVLAGGATLACLLRLRRWEVATYPNKLVVRLGKYAPASACLMGWLLALLLADALGYDEATQRARGWDAAAGVFGGCYVLAGIAKIRESGWDWGRAESMSVMLAERGFGRLGGLRLALAQSRAACTVIGVTGMGIELGAIAFVWPPARPWLAMAVVGFKAMTWGLFGYFEPEWTLAVIAIGVAAAAIGGAGWGTLG